MRSGKQQMTKRIELRNQDKIRALAEKETYKYLGILEADTVKYTEMKEKIKKNTSGERKYYSKPRILQKSHQRVK